MKDESGIRYCNECGNELQPDETFCPQCGAIYREEDDAKWEAEEAAAPPADATPTLIMTGVLLWAWAVMSLVEGAVALAIPDYLVSAAQSTVSDPTLIGYATWDAYREALEYSGVIYLVSGALAAASGTLTVLRRFWTPAVVLCGASSVTVLALIYFGDYTSILMALCGGCVAYTLFTQDFCFKD